MSIGFSSLSMEFLYILRSFNELQKFVVRFWLHWRPPEGIHFHWRGLNKCCLQFKTLCRVIYIPLEGFRYPFYGFIIPLEGFRYLSRGCINPLEGFRYPSYGFIIPLEGFRNLSRGFIIPLEGFRYLSRGFINPLEEFRYLSRKFKKISESLQCKLPCFKF